MKSISFSGKMASGKDTMGAMFMKAFPQAKHLAFGDALKAELNEYLNYLRDNKKAVKPEDMDIEVFNELKKIAYDSNDSAYDKTVEIRRALQLYGTDYRRKNNPDYWVKKCEAIILEDPNGVYCVTDARFKNEIKMLENHGFNLVRLEVEPKDQIERIKKRDGITPNEINFTHKSENDYLDCANFDLILNTSKLDPYMCFYVLLNNLYGADTNETR